MSYDLHLKPRAGSLAEGPVLEYFRARANYTVENQQARYENKDTDVSFLFEMHSGEPGSSNAGYPVAFNLNLFRPSYFVHEAEPEIAAFVREFDCVVFDPQIQSVGHGEYESDKFVSAWNHSNEFAYQAALAKKENRTGLFTFPTAGLHGVWKWNYERAALQERVGGEKFVPLISFLLIEGRVSTAIVWGDGIPMVFPAVDYMLAYRVDLAPRRLLERTPDFALLSWQDAWSMLGPYMSAHSDRAFALNYEQPPHTVVGAIRSLGALSTTPDLLSMDMVLDDDIVAKIPKRRAVR